MSSVNLPNDVYLYDPDSGQISHETAVAQPAAPHPLYALVTPRPPSSTGSSAPRQSPPPSINGEAKSPDSPVHDAPWLLNFGESLEKYAEQHGTTGSPAASIDSMAIEVEVEEEPENVAVDPPQQAIGGAGSIQSSKRAHSGNDSISDIPVGPMPMPTGPVFNAADGDLNLANLDQAVAGLLHQLPMLPKPSPRAEVRLREELVRHLSVMRRLAQFESEQPADQRMPPHELGLNMRAACRAAEKAASQLAAKMVRSNRQLGTEFLLLAGVCKEMKRAHLSGAAQHILEEYATRQTAHLNKKCPGIGEQRAGAMITGGKGLGLSWGPNLPLDVLNFNVGGTGAREHIYFVDEQNSVFGQSYFRFHGEGNMIGYMGKWKGKAKFRAGTHFLGNDRVGTRMVGGPSLKDVVKLYNAAESDKALMKTASPKAQALRKSYQQARNVLTTTVLGRTYAKEPGAPTYLSREKLAKGFNVTKLQMLVDAFDQAREARTGHRGELGALMRASYPSMHDAMQEAQQNSKPLPQRGIHNSMPRESFFGYACDPFLSAELSAEKTGGKTIDKRGATMGVTVAYDTLMFPNWLPHLTHQALDFDFAKDAAETMMAHAKLDNLVASHAPDPKPPELHLYAAVSRQLGGDTQLQIKLRPDLDDVDKDYYQGPRKWPVPMQFLDAIQNPSVDKLQNAAAVATALGQLRTDFVQHAHTLTARPERSWPALLRQELQDKRKAAFALVNEQVWGGRYPGGEKAALRNPEKFVGETQGALSVAFGAAGTHLSIQKRQMKVRGMTSADDAAAVRRADAAYAQARKVFDHDNLTLPQQTLGEGTNSAFNIYQMFRKHTVAMTANVTGGWTADTVEATAKDAGGTTQSIPLPGIPQSPPDPNITQEGISVSATTRLGQAAFSVRGRWQNMDLQDSPGRQGQYLELTLTGTGGGLLGPILRDAAGQVLKKVGLNPSTATPSVLTNATRQGAGMVLSLDEGTKATVRMRMAPGNDNFDLEYVRVLNVKDHGLFPSVEVRTPTDVITVSPASADKVEIPGREFRGPDLYYLIAQQSSLREKFIKDEKVGGSVRRLFKRHPDMLAAYCGIGATIPTVIDRYMAVMGDDADPAARRNEFHRFFKDLAFERVARLANDVKSHAPGSRAKDDDPFAEPKPISEPVRWPEGFDWSQAKAEISLHKTLEERKTYYTSEPGRKVFKVFFDILEQVHAVDAAASLHHDDTRTYGFHAELNPRLKKQVRRVAGNADTVDRLKSIFKKPEPTPATPYGTLTASGPVGTLFAAQGGPGVAPAPDADPAT